MQPSAVEISRDVYANLLRDTRGLRREQANAREAWFAALPWKRKERTLFELEMLLKGLVCFGNFRNHPGSQVRSSLVAHDFREDLRIVRDTLDRVVRLVRQLLGSRDRTYTFTRYLQTVLPEDAERSRLVKEQLTQDTPQESLFVVRNAFGGYRELADAVLRLGHVSNRHYFALHGAVTREVERNEFFNPLVSLEFRPEFDRIRVPEVLEALQSVSSDTAHRVVALTFLVLFRVLRYLQLVDEHAADPATAHQAYVVLAVLRSDVRALTRFLGVRVNKVLADGLERELLAMPASFVSDHHDDLARRMAALVPLRITLETISQNLRVDVRKVFDRDVPPPSDAMPGRDLAPKLTLAAATLRAVAHHAIATLCLELKPDRKPPDLAEDEGSKRARSERLRREAWMFSQVLRAFLAKAAAQNTNPNLWDSYSSFRFVREFLKHFRSMGYQLVRMSDYDRLDPLLDALEQLKDTDLLEAPRIAHAVAECNSLYSYLEELFEQVSRRAELTDVPFDKKAAADTLKIHLGVA